MLVYFECESCSKRLRTRAAPGVAVRCPGCGKFAVVPGEPAEAMALDLEPPEWATPRRFEPPPDLGVVVRAEPLQPAARLVLDRPTRARPVAVAIARERPPLLGGRVPGPTLCSGC